jgi:hypothetical protein
MHDMPAPNTDTTHPSISDQIMKDKNCNFKFRKVSVEEVKKLLLSKMTSHRAGWKITEDNSDRI